MSKIIIFMFVLYVVAIAGAFFIEGPDGKPIASIEKTKSLAVEKLAFIKDVVDIDYDSGSSNLTGLDDASVYRWKSEDGTWMYGDSPPNVNSAELLVIDTEANILPSQTATGEEDNFSSTDKKGLANIPVLGTLEATKDIKKQISELEKQIQARDEQIR